MKARLLYDKPSAEHLKQLDSQYHRHDYGEVDMEVLVLGIAYLQSPYMGRTMHLEYMCGKNQITSAPAMLFEITDATVSKYWTIKMHEEGSVTMRHPDFDTHNFYEDLSEDEPWAVEIFNRVYKQLEEEHAAPIVETNPQAAQVELEYA